MQHMLLSLAYYPACMLAHLIRHSRAALCGPQVAVEHTREGSIPRHVRNAFASLAKSGA